MQDVWSQVYFVLEVGGLCVLLFLAGVGAGHYWKTRQVRRVARSGASEHRVAQEGMRSIFSGRGGGG